MWDEIFINIRQLPVQMRTTSSLCRSVLVLISSSPCRLYFEEQSFVGQVSIHSFQGYFTHRGVTGSAASSLWTSFRKNLILKVFEARFYRGEYSNLMGTGWWFVGWLADWHSEEQQLWWWQRLFTRRHGRECAWELENYNYTHRDRNDNFKGSITASIWPSTVEGAHVKQHSTTANWGLPEDAILNFTRWHCVRQV